MKKFIHSRFVVRLAQCLALCGITGTFVACAYGVPNPDRYDDKDDWWEYHYGTPDMSQTDKQQSLHQDISNV